ncbi:MAG: SusD/RagB family nutrient-binding outer membrane lipoprotein [Bacteroidetes bacterium]|jgi:hypothetical protein|nr:SusD/RagB family nutrient-binding outer membrane lipoprotein [Bacteroidota bacterium]
MRKTLKQQIDMKYLKFYIALLTILIIGSCTKLEDLNENPNQPDEVSQDVLLTSAMRSSMNSMVTESFLLGNNAAQLTAKTLRTEVDRYAWNAFPTVWESLYQSLITLREAEKVAVEDGDEITEGIASIMEAWIFSTLTMAYGDIPYTSALMGVDEGLWFPAYDEQEFIFTDTEEGLLAQLEKAVDLLNNATGSINGDIILEGDPEQWVKFANSLQLRLLMHLSNKIDVSTRFAEIVNEGNIIASNADNVTLDYLGSFPNEYPLVPLKQGDFDAVVMSTSLVREMQDTVAGTRDPRLAVYARPDNIIEMVEDQDLAPLFDGGVNGLETGDCDKSGSRLGLAYYDYPGHPSVTDKAEGIIMTYAEVEFLLAEAAEKGWIANDVESHYKSGIQASMDYYTVEYESNGWDDFEDFYTNSGVAYDNTLLSIRKEKWKVLFFHGLEPYFELRRWMYESDYEWAALPFVAPPCQNENDDQLPLRFLYPGNEQSLNADNYDDAVDRFGEEGNSQMALMWLLKE